MENCVGECFSKNEKALHPLTLEVLINNKDEVLCPSQPRVEILDRYDQVADVMLCTAKKVPEFEEVANYMYTPEIKFVPETFLQLFDIYSFTSAIMWALQNLDKDTPILTILRNLNVAWKLYHSNIKKVSNDIVNCYVIIYDTYLKMGKIQDINLKKKIIKKSLKKFLKETNNWDSSDFNSLEIIKKNIKKYNKKYSKV
ncbi:hypothetical protein CPAV1605_298 [seawater metagenome]|uniref:Uncharacterized protein n=1 Tax=seawater metagenome TaxID=1561972 RepID=A0A5E8CGM8_9ZZZZ